MGDIIAESKIGGYEAAKTVTWLRDQGLILDPAEAERIISHLLSFLNILLKDFSKNGLNWMKQWAEEDGANKKILDAVDINEETLEITPVGELTTSEIEKGIETLLKYIETKGPKLYGKVLFKKKWQGFKKKIEVQQK